MAAALRKLMKKQAKNPKMVMLVIFSFVMGISLIAVSIQESKLVDADSLTERMTVPQFRPPLDTKTKERREAVVRTFQHAWGGYVTFAPFEFRVVLCLSYIFCLFTFVFSFLQVQSLCLGRR